MTTTTTRYHLISRTSNVYLGTYAGSTPREAIRAMHRDAGYKDSRDAAKALGVTVKALIADIRAVLGRDTTSATTRATIRAVAEAMVRADRSSRDCEVREDASADDGSGWDDYAIGELAVHLAPSIEDGERWAESHREAILDAYAVAWREAVEAAR